LAPWSDTGPPYSAFGTWHNFTLTKPVEPNVTLFFRRVLRRRGWVWRGGSPGESEATFRRGLALLYVVGDSNGTLLMNVDYRGYGGAGH
jgi:hypothetical protein